MGKGISDFHKYLLKHNIEEDKEINIEKIFNKFIKSFIEYSLSFQSLIVVNFFGNL